MASHILKGEIKQKHNSVAGFRILPQCSLFLIITLKGFSSQDRDKHLHRQAVAEHVKNFSPRQHKTSVVKLYTWEHNIRDEQLFYIVSLLQFYLADDCKNLLINIIILCFQKMHNIHNKQGCVF